MMNENYKEWLEDYESSDNRKVFDILTQAGWRLGINGQTLVSNTLKKHKNNIKKTASEIIKRYPQLKDTRN
jgi:hypothetical protein